MKGGKKLKDVPKIVKSSKALTTEKSVNDMEKVEVVDVYIQIDCGCPEVNSAYIKKKAWHYALVLQGQDPKEGFVTLSSIRNGNMNTLPSTMEGKPRPPLIPFNKKRLINGSPATEAHYQGLVPRKEYCAFGKFEKFRSGFKIDPNEEVESPHIVQQILKGPSNAMESLCENCPHRIVEEVKKG